MAPVDLTARPFTLAEIIDRAVALGRQHFAALFAIMLAVQVPLQLVARTLPDPLALLGGHRSRAVEQLADALRPLGLALLAALALQFLATALAAAVAGPRLDPRRGTARPSALRRAWAVTTALVAQVAVTCVAPVLGFAPGAILAIRGMSLGTQLAGLVGALVGGVGLFVIVTLRLLCAPEVAALEGRPGLAALVRSSRLMTPRAGARFWERPGVRASLVLLASVVLAMAAGSLAGIPRLVAHAFLGDTGLSALAAPLPIGLEVPITVLETAASAAVQPFSLMVQVVFYFDRRARAEALDLEIWADGLEPTR